MARKSVSARRPNTPAVQRTGAEIVRSLVGYISEAAEESFTLEAYLTALTESRSYPDRLVDAPGSDFFAFRFRPEVGRSTWRAIGGTPNRRRDQVMQRAVDAIREELELQGRFDRLADALAAPRVADAFRLAGEALDELAR